MTADEAEQGAAERHEFREFIRQDGIVIAVCWCDWPSANYHTDEAARNSHGRHQLREAAQRSFEPRPHP